MAETLSNQERQELAEIYQRLTGGGPKDLCQTWKEVGPKWLAICWAVAFIPFVGPAASLALLAIGVALSVICGFAGAAEADAEQKQFLKLSDELIVGGNDLCKQWKIVKPYWNTIIDYVRRYVGNETADLLALLGKEIDKRCP